MKWNKITSNGGVLLAEGLSQNNYLSVLDLSHNGLGHYYPSIKCGKDLMSAVCRKRAAMKHFDLSYNHFTLDEIKEMEPVLRENHTLFGFHIEGNSN